LACHYNRTATSISPLDAFNIANILIVYAIIFVLTGLLFMYKKWYKKTYKKDIDERTMSVATGYTNQKFKVSSEILLPKEDK